MPVEAKAAPSSRAVVMHGPFGTLDAVRLEERERPRPKRGEVLVRMRLSPVNPSDLNYVHGSYAEFLKDLAWNDGSPLRFDPKGLRVHPSQPFVMGGEGMGVVVESGGGLLARRLVGKRVAVAGSPTGVWQSYAVVNARRAVPLPSAVPDEQGAMFFVNPLTAVAMVENVLALPRGSFLLQTAAGSALAAIVRAIARERGIVTIDLVRRREAAEALRSSGVAHALCIDDDVLAEVRRITAGRGVDGALDCIGGAYADLAMRALGRYGKLVLFGTLGNEPTPLEARALMMRAGLVQGFFLPHWLDAQNPFVLLRTLGRVKRLLASGAVSTKIRAAYRLDAYREALDAAAAGGDGKIMLRFDD